MTNRKISYTSFNDQTDDLYDLMANSDQLNVLIGIVENINSTNAQLLYDLTSNEMLYERNHNLPRVSDDSELVPVKYAEYINLANYLEQTIIPYLDNLNENNPIIKDKNMDVYNSEALRKQDEEGKYWLDTVNELRGIDISPPFISFLAERLVKLYRFAESNQVEITVY